MKRLFLLGTSIMLLLFTAAFATPSPSGAALPGVVYQEDFEDGEAQGWELEPGWQVQTDDGDHVLAGEGHVWARAGESFDGDLTQSFRIKLIRGRVHIVVRLTEAARYFIGFETSGSDLNKQYFPSDFQHGLASLGAAHAVNRWYQVEVVLRGSTIELLVDGVKQWSYEDAQPLDGGSFAFETLEDSLVYVDDIRIDVPSVAGTAMPAATAVLAAPPTSAPAATAVLAAAPTSAAAVAPVTSLTWVRTGGPLGGLGYDVRMRPDNPDVMFVTDAWAGLFKSTDAGKTWFPSNSGISTRVGPTGDGIPVFSVTIDPNNPDTVWAGTQFQRGIFKSVDGGQSWTRKDNGIAERDGVTFRGFTVEPGNSNVVYAAAEISSWAWAGYPRNGREFDMTRGVIYKTTNGGDTWQAVWRGDNLARYIWINPQDTNVLYISTGFFDREAANSDPKDALKATPGGEGIMKSTDGGKTWSAANNGLHNLYVTSLFMNPAEPNVLLAGAGNNQYYQGAGIYLTTDGAASWKNIYPTAPFGIQAVEFSTSDPSIAYAGNDLAIYRSEDGGRNWSRASGSGNWGPPGVTAGFPIDFQIDPRNPQRVFANVYGGGNFLTVDGGRTWTDASRGYTGALMRGLAADPSDPATIYAVARSGLFASYDGGSSWQALGHEPLHGNDWTVVAVNPKNPRHILARTGWIGLGSSADGGKTWKVVLRDEAESVPFRVLAFNPSDPGTVYGGVGGFTNVGVWNSGAPGKGVYVSHDGGVTWTPSNSGPSVDANVAGLLVDPNDPLVLYAATTNHSLLSSRDGAKTWNPVGGGLPGSRSALSVAMAPGNPALMLVGFERGSVYRSDDGGASWRRSAAGLHPEASVTSIVFDPQAAGTVVYLSDVSSGVYRSTDGGRTWSAINQGLTSRAINQLAISVDGQHLYAGTEGAGVFRLDLNGQPPVSSAPAQATSAPQAAPTATSYQYGGPTATPSTTESKPGGGLPFCSSAALPIGMVAVGLWWRRRGWFHRGGEA